MQRDKTQDRTIHCKYEPREPGDYQVEVKWHGQHVPGKLKSSHHDYFTFACLIELPPALGLKYVNFPFYRFTLLRHDC